MNTATLPGWLPTVLVLLCGVVGWMLLRPYRRIIQLGGKEPLAATAAGGLGHRREARPAQVAARAVAREGAGRVPQVPGERSPTRVELRAEAPPATAAETDPAAAPRLPPGPAGQSRAATRLSQRRCMRAQAGVRRRRAKPGTLYRPARHPATTVESRARPSRIEARPEP